LLGKINFADRINLTATYPLKAARGAGARPSTTAFINTLINFTDRRGIFCDQALNDQNRPRLSQTPRNALLLKGRSRPPAAYASEL
jgi:hypothetical protein